ncbi:hypothetical protein TPAR_03319 [Tolypocladium paradoxum]|uniref:Uncharacterized protein n=1 Tax=Tolypocladium paradoxum TaxID=94208 RepID=A0A2S4L216_9HYPO|nr:hypothetical protein TPAR_03319 [Tolypocladium paradoxum]
MVHGVKICGTLRVPKSYTSRRAAAAPAPHGSDGEERRGPSGEPVLRCRTKARRPPRTRDIRLPGFCTYTARASALVPPRSASACYEYPSKASKRYDRLQSQGDPVNNTERRNTRSI